MANAEHSSASILSISYLYIRAMGHEIRRNTEIAILNANYMASKLGKHYPVLFKNSEGRVAHEFILDLRPIKRQSGISEEDIAKRLIDFGFHSPTMSFPVAGTIMIEPTESENIQELDRFIEALVQIKAEINKVMDGTFDKLDNPLKNAPHTVEEVTASTWDHKYTREEAAYPLPWVQYRAKYFYQKLKLFRRRPKNFSEIFSKKIRKSGFFLFFPLKSGHFFHDMSKLFQKTTKSQNYTGAKVPGFIEIFTPVLAWRG